MAEEIEATPERLTSCLHCNTMIPARSNYCYCCGQLPRTHFNIADQLRTDRGVLLRTIAFYLFLIGIILANTLSNPLAENAYDDFLYFQMFFVSTTIAIGALYGGRWFNEAFRLAEIQPKAVAITLLTPLITVPFVAYSMEFIVTFLGGSVANNYDAFADSSQPLLYATVSVALIPAVFEEIAFRGFLMSDLLQSFNTKVSILLTSALFVFAHFSILSVYWMLPFALLLGYLRLRYRTIWLGIIVHFLHNFGILILDYLD